VRHNATATRERALVGLGTNNVHRAHSHRVPTCEAWSSRTQGLGQSINSGVSVTADYPRANCSCCFSLHSDSITLKEHYSINSLWISH
jgi:hypothetical protein